MRSLSMMDTAGDWSRCVEMRVVSSAGEATMGGWLDERSPWSSQAGVDDARLLGRELGIPG